MEESDDQPVYQYFTIISEPDNGTEDEAKKDDEGTHLVYLTFSGEDEEASTSESVVQAESDHEFNTLPSFGSNVKIITMEDGRMFMTTSTEEENFDTIEPHLITGEDEAEEEQKIVKDNETFTTSEDSVDDLDYKYEIVQLVNDPPPLIKMVYCDNNEEETTNEDIKKEKKFKCIYDGCDKAYATSYQMTVHMRGHMDCKPFKCTADGCDKRFSTNYLLKAHFRTHTGEKPYGCTICFKHFKTSGDLQKHIRIHTGEKPFVCPIAGCGKSFTTSNIRKVHIRSHTGERPYTCNYPHCGKAFSSSTNYKNHIRIHSGEKPYVCQVEGCYKRFTEYSSLYKHNLVHQPNRPFTCVFCDQKFKQESAMNLHKRVKHNVILASDGTEIVVDLN